MTRSAHPASTFSHFRERMLERYGLDVTPEQVAQVEAEIRDGVHPQARVRHGAGFLVSMMGLRVLVIYDGVLVTALPLEARRKPPVIRPQKRCPYCRIREHARNRGVRPPSLPACH